MAVLERQRRATAKYEAKAYDKTLLRLPKGRICEIKAHIALSGESLNGFITRAIGETMKREQTLSHGGEIPLTLSSGEGIPLTLSHGEGIPLTLSPGGGIPLALSPDTIACARKAAEDSGETLRDFIGRAVETQSRRDVASRRMGFNPVTNQRLRREDKAGVTVHTEEKRK